MVVACEAGGRRSMMLTEKRATQADAHRRAAEALQLRSWALRLLLQNRSDPVPQASAAAWHFFTRMEWCSLPLERALEAAAVQLPKQNAAREIIAAAAALERSRVESARERMAAVADTARRHGWRVVVLKGGAAVANGAELHLEDVDFTADAETARALIRELDPRAQHGPWSEGQYRIAGAGTGAAAIEVHTAVRELAGCELLERTVAVPGLADLRQLDASLHLAHLLTHSTRSHPDRLGRLRDILLLRWALQSCTEREQLEARRVAAQVDEPTLDAVLRMARAGTVDRGIERAVRRRYFLLARWERLGEHRALRMLLTIATELTPPRRGDVVRKLFTPPDRPSAFPGMAKLFRRAPQLDRALRLVMRPVVMLGAFGLCTGAAIEELIGSGRAGAPR
jgi:hypothetical protein